MEIADVDESETIDLEELKELVTKLECTMNEDSIKEIFDKEDSNADGELSKVEFGNALFSILKITKETAVEEDAENTKLAASAAEEAPEENKAEDEEEAKPKK